MNMWILDGGIVRYDYGPEVAGVRALRALLAVSDRSAERGSVRRVDDEVLAVLQRRGGRGRAQRAEVVLEPAPEGEVGV